MVTIPLEPSLNRCSSLTPPSVVCETPANPFDASMVPVADSIKKKELYDFMDSWLQLDVSPLRYCSPSKVTLTKLDGSAFSYDEVDSVEIYLHFYTQVDDAGNALGTPCVRGAQGACRHMQRRVLMRRSEDEMESVGAFIPDSAASDYSIEVRVGASGLFLSVTVTVHLLCSLQAFDVRHNRYSTCWVSDVMQPRTFIPRTIPVAFQLPNEASAVNTTAAAEPEAPVVVTDQCTPLLHRCSLTHFAPVCLTRTVPEFGSHAG